MIKWFSTSHIMYDILHSKLILLSAFRLNHIQRMVVIKKFDHAPFLLERLHQFRVKQESTDLEIISANGDCFSAHLLLFKAFATQHQIQAAKPKAQFKVQACNEAVRIFVDYLYTGSIDMTNCDPKVMSDLQKLSDDCMVTELQKTLSPFKQNHASETSIQKPEDDNKGCDETNKSTPCTSLDSDNVNDGNVVDREIESKDKPNENTKLLLKRFLNKKNTLKTSDSNQHQNQQSSESVNHVEVNSSNLSENMNLICCHLCGKIIAKKGFTAHMKVHLNIKDKTCEKCGKRFRKACNLQEHWQRMHLPSEDKPHSCPRCGASFAIRSDLTRHIARHDAKTCFVCELCGASFVGKRMWRKHKCMDDIFTGDLTATLRDHDGGTPSDQEINEDTGEDDELLTLLPLDFTDGSGTNEILSEIDGLFYENLPMDTH